MCSSCGVRRSITMLIPAVAFYPENQTYGLDVNYPLGWFVASLYIIPWW